MLSGGCVTVGVAEISTMPALVGASSFAWAAVFQESERGTPFPRHPAPRVASTEHRPGREEQGGDRNVASKPGLLTGGQSVSSGFQLGCSQVEKQLKPEVDASLHLCAT